MIPDLYPTFSCRTPEENQQIFQVESGEYVHLSNFLFKSMIVVTINMRTYVAPPSVLAA